MVCDIALQTCQSEPVRNRPDPAGIELIQAPNWRIMDWPLASCNSYFHLSCSIYYLLKYYFTAPFPLDIVLALSTGMLAGYLTRVYPIFREFITWASVDLDLCRHMASLGHNELSQYWGSTKGHRMTTTMDVLRKTGQFLFYGAMWHNTQLNRTYIILENRFRVRRFLSPKPFEVAMLRRTCGPKVLYSEVHLVRRLLCSEDSTTQRRTS